MWLMNHTVCSVITSKQIYLLWKYVFFQQALKLDGDTLQGREVVDLDIAHDEIAEKSYKKEEVGVFVGKVEPYRKFFCQSTVTQSSKYNMKHAYQSCAV